MVEKMGNFERLEEFASSNWIKASNLGDKREDWAFVVLTEVKERKDDKGAAKNVPVLHLDYNKSVFHFELNKTNRDQLIKLGWSNWNKLIGHRILLQKIMVSNPSTKQLQEGLFVGKVE